MMDRIYEENLNEWNEFLADQNGEYDIEIDCQTLKRIVTELKERREADSKPLDIKAQLRMVRDKCPAVWKVLAIDAICPADLSIGSALSDCHAGLTSNKNCKECWDKALEGDE